MITLLWRIIDKLFRILDSIRLRAHTVTSKRLYTGRNVFFDNVNSRILNGKNDPKLIKIGDNTSIAGELKIFKSGGEISIGENCYLGDRSRIWSQNRIVIGNNVLISHSVNIHDTNAHETDYKMREISFIDALINGESEKNTDVRTDPIIIEDNVWIGFNSIVLKGVRIGARSIVAAGSVVTNDVPSDVIVAGNPAITIKRISDHL